MTDVGHAIAGEDARIAVALERFQSGDDAEPRDVRLLIGESWQRCFRTGLHLSARSRTPPRNATGSQPARSGELHEASDAVMAQARSALAGCRTMMALVDAAGFVLCADGDDNAVADAASMGLIPGSNWSEACRGTNGLGTSLYVGGHVQVHGPEHYCASACTWTCTANVVRDPVDTTVVGALSVSGPADAFDPHLLPLVLASSERVRAALEERTRLAQFEDTLRKLDEQVKRLSA